jgi:hypothetical protein
MGNVAGRLGPRRAFSWKRPRCEAPATLKIGTALTAATALRTSFPAAGADEEPELQVKQELLKQRIEQLASRAGGSVPAGTTMLGGSFPRSFLIPGSDTSIRVGGFVDETFNYYFQNGPPNGTESTTVGITGNLATQALEVYGQTVPGLRPRGIWRRSTLRIPAAGSSCKVHGNRVSASRRARRRAGVIRAVSSSSTSRGATISAAKTCCTTKTRWCRA